MSRNAFMYDHTLHGRKKIFCCYCLQAFSTEEIIKSRINDCFTINGKQMMQMSKEGEYVKFRNYERKVKSPLSQIIFMQILKVFWCQKIMKSIIQTNFIRPNTKNMLLEVVAINYYALMIILVSLLNLT